MPYGLNAVAPDKIQQYQGVASNQVINAVKKASDRTGVEFTYLMEQAAAESSFDPKAQAKTSSARGLYQFIDNTWLQMVDKHGQDYGLGHYADKIQIADNGKAQVTDPKLKERILSLRDNPYYSAMMAAEFTSGNKEQLENKVDGRIGKTELYFAHFMGAGGATKFLNSMHENKSQIAADLFPQAAKANKNVFFDPETGNARTLKQVYDFFDKKFQEKNVTSIAKAVIEVLPVSKETYIPQAQRVMASMPSGYYRETSPVDVMMMVEMMDILGELMPSDDDKPEDT